MSTIWNNISLALGAEPREYPIIKGISGLEHHFLSIAVDEEEKRIVLISADPDPRIAALTQVDVQAALTDFKVLVARPVVLDLGVLTRQLVDVIGSEELDLQQFVAVTQKIEKLSEEEKTAFMEQQLGGAFERIGAAFENVPMPFVAQIVSVVQQAAQLDWQSLLSDIRTEKGSSVISLRGLLEIDNLSIDRINGVCPLPLYAFDAQDWDLFNSKDDIPAIRNKLTEMDIYQYFYPPIDELALGCVDRQFTDQKSVSGAIVTADELGHTISKPSIVDSDSGPDEIIESLQDLGLATEGEIGIELTPEGKAYRATIKFRPKESLIDKVLSRCSFEAKANLHDLLK